MGLKYREGTHLGQIVGRDEAVPVNVVDVEEETKLLVLAGRVGADTKVGQPADELWTKKKEVKLGVSL